MGVWLVGNKKMNWAASHHIDSVNAVRREAREVEGRARRGLATARDTTPWHKIIGPGNLTRIESEAQGIPDVLVSLVAPNAMAIEFGHMPSGVFGPGGKFGHIETKAPDGLYILHKAGRIL